MKNPFIAGNWVRGKKFFGRKKLLNEILSGNRHYLWVAGPRRVGKTSLLRQIEYLTQQESTARKYISLFWDLQGSHDLDGLRETLLESIEDADVQFSQIGVEVNEIEEQELFPILRILKRRAKEAHLNLMLLCDEAEELISIEQNSPNVLPKLRRFFQRGDNVYTVLTATKRLSLLERTTIPNTSPFLHGFVPPLYLSRMEAEEARKIVDQWNFPDDVVEQIIEKTDNHPYLIQLICGRQVEINDLEKVIAEVSHDDMISSFFNIDFQTLELIEREIVLRLLQEQELTLAELQTVIHESKDTLIKHCYQLMQLGFIKQVGVGYCISNYFFSQWLNREKEKLYTESTLRPSDVAQTLPEPVKPVHLPEIGDRLAHHEILEVLGSGGMGIVFKGRDLDLDRLVALKILLPEFMKDDEVKQRFIQEAKAASAMNHPNICTIYQSGDDSGLSFFSMEYIRGLNLRQWSHINQDSFQLKLDIALQIGMGFAHAHEKGVAHRDIKPENILISQEGVAKITDFGLAQVLTRVDKHITQAGTTLGTLSYMSPEQASGLKTDHRSDLFSFGILLYELFAGQLPFSGEFELSVLYGILNEEPKPIREVNPELPVALEDIIGKALAKEPEKRYASFPDLVRDLKRIGG
ncbi:MAG: protein kinase [bacterium]